MKNTVLITERTSGTGLAVAIRYLHDGSKVIISGRNAKKRKGQPSILGDWPLV